MTSTDENVHGHHTIDYIELAVTDIDAAKAFYTTAFGWSLVDYGPDYAGIQGKGKPGACGVTPRSERADPW
jgi:predicted enzyme related to lactoylglutathione lyase